MSKINVGISSGHKNALWNLRVPGGPYSRKSMGDILHILIERECNRLNIEDFPRDYKEWWHPDPAPDWSKFQDEVVALRQEVADLKERRTKLEAQIRLLLGIEVSKVKEGVNKSDVLVGLEEMLK